MGPAASIPACENRVPLRLLSRLGEVAAHQYRWGRERLGWHVARTGLPTDIARHPLRHG